MGFTYLDEDCNLSREVLIKMYNALVEYQFNTEHALEMARDELAILRGEVDTIPLE